MGQKVNPILYRLSFNKHWKSPSFTVGNGVNLSDIKLRYYLKNLLGNDIDNIIIKKYPYLNSIYITTKATTIKPDILNASVIKHIQLLTGYKKVTLQLSKPKTFKSIPLFSAQLLSKYIAKLIETRKLKTIKKILSALKENSPTKGWGYAIKISGRINGVAMARHKIYKRGNLPLQSITSSIDYGYNTAMTKYGIIGVKVWLSRN